MQTLSNITYPVHVGVDLLHEVRHLDVSFLGGHLHLGVKIRVEVKAREKVHVTPEGRGTCNGCVGPKKKK